MRHAINPYLALYAALIEGLVHLICRTYVERAKYAVRTMLLKAAKTLVELRGIEPRTF